MEAQLVQLLAPFLPRLLASAAKQVEEHGGEIAEAAWTYAQKVWERLRPAVEAKPEAQDAAGKVAEAPDDDKARTVLEVRLADILAGDDKLKADLTTLLEEATRAGVRATSQSFGDVHSYATGHGTSYGVVGGDVTNKK